MANCLVTGGSGFIGSHLCRGLLEMGYNVKILDNLSSGKFDNIQDVADRIEFIQGDIRDENALFHAMVGVEYVFHLAAVASVQISFEQPILEQQVNCVGTLQVLETARNAGVQRVIFAASAAAYGNDPCIPKCESMAPAPASPYAVSKVVGEYYCKIYSDQHELETICLRYFNVYGTRQDPTSPYSGVISIFVKKMLRGESPIIFGDGRQTRDFVSVGDIVAANILALKTERAEGQIYNIGTGRSTNLIDLVQVLNQIGQTHIKPKLAPARAGDLRASLADISRAKTELGYEPDIGLERGLTDIVDWMSDFS